MEQRIVVGFPADDVEVEVAAGARLVDVCDENPVSLLFGCREANCGTCLIEVLGGLEHLSPMTDNERDLLEIMAPDNSRARLACQCAVFGDVQVQPLD